MIVIHGIPTCGTVKKVINWLADNNVEYRFHDFRRDGLSKDMLQAFFAALPWEKLVNKSSTSWRALSDDQKASLSKDSAFALMMEQPTLIKRPVWEKGGEYRLGYAPKEQDMLHAWALA